MNPVDCPPSSLPAPPQYRFIEPLDVLFLRGNQLFGAPGSYGEALMPPWPSVAAGAIRSRMLADDGVDLAAFGQGAVAHASLGTPQQPGPFVLHAFCLGRERGGKAEILVATPADLVVHQKGEGNAAQAQAQALAPTALHPAMACSSVLPLLPVLAQPDRSKASSGWWLTQTGWRQYLAGQAPASSELVASSQLWSMDERVGVGLDTAIGSAEDGKLFTSRAVVLKQGIGFVAAVTGAPVPVSGLLRLGGDGRAASIRPAAIDWPEPDYQALAQRGRCRLVLTSPGLFAQGWLAHGMAPDGQGGHRFELHGVRARLVAASVARSDVASGWDLARRQPKPAQRMAPTGSVYWLDGLEASADALRKLAAAGLWSDTCEDPARRAEGFNRLALAAWN